MTDKHNDMTEKTYNAIMRVSEKLAEANAIHRESNRLKKAELLVKLGQSEQAMELLRG